MNLKFLFLFLFAASLMQAQKHSVWFFVKSYDTLSPKNSFKLLNGSRSKQVFVNHDLSVHYRTPGHLNNDSLSYRVRGPYVAIENDSMTIVSGNVCVHDYYKWNNDSSYRYHSNTSHGFARVPMKDITKIYYERSQWKKVNAGITVLSLATAFIAAPLLALDGGELDLLKFRKVAYPALGVAVASVGVGIIFSQRKFRILKPKTNSRVWTIDSGKEYHASN